MLNTDATLNAEGGEECGEYAHDELEHRLESFFGFCVFHAILIIKVTDVASGCLRDAFGRRVLILYCKVTTFADCNHTMWYVSDTNFEF